MSRSRRYWPDSTPAERRTNLLGQFRRIFSALSNEVGDIHLKLPDCATGVVSTAGLKRYEDSLDALVCAWVGARYLEGAATPYGDSTAAIWIS